ncbi:interferon-induced very large GTPase 1-like [Protopterus annectens]|uniref:interferon-induced very large GTPase 1-like n=1 Tax=Protopterus annectens TaxID=7888 RepID=UPI001CF9F130|nr:interferon-induced very large GTPase 1-like [Protopterus annectens]
MTSHLEDMKIEFNKISVTFQETGYPPALIKEVLDEVYAKWGVVCKPLLGEGLVTSMAMDPRYKKEDTYEKACVLQYNYLSDEIKGAFRANWNIFRTNHDIFNRVGTKPRFVNSTGPNFKKLLDSKVDSMDIISALSEDGDVTSENKEERFLAQKLKDEGLNEAYWLPILKKELGVTCVQTLKNMNTKDYEKLKSHVQFEWEKNALHTVLGIPNKKARIEELQKEKSESFNKKQEEAQLLLDDLQKIQTEGKNCSDDIVRSKVEEMYTALNIPKEHLMSSGTNLKDLIDNLHRELIIPLDCPVLQYENLSDEDILKFASGGLALEGIYRSSRIEDLFVKRKQLLNIPEMFSLSGPEHGPLFEMKEFSSCESEDTFMMALEKIGFNITGSAKGSIWGFSLQTSTQYSKASESEEKHSSSHEYRYICTTKYNYIPLASCYFGKNQLQLSNAALDELKRYEDILSYSMDSDDMLNLFSSFFTRFGSHACQGPICFGGVFCWKASSKGFSAEEQTEIQKQTSEALNAYYSGSYWNSTLSFTAGDGVTNSSSEGSLEVKSEKSVHTDIELSVNKIGGPPEIDSFHLWKSALAANNKTWAVIDRGLKLIPVWDIILSNHKNDFKDVLKLWSNLAEAYKFTTKQNAEILWEDKIHAAAAETESFIHSIKSWNVENAKQHLREIEDFKDSLFQKTKNDKMWTDKCLSNKEFQAFCKKVVSEYESASSADVADLRAQMRYILEPHVYDVQNFQDRSYVMKWINQSEKLQQSNDVSDVSQLVSILNHEKYKLQEFLSKSNPSNSETDKAKTKATNIIGLSIYSLCNKLKETQQLEIEFLLWSVVLPFGYSIYDKTFHNILWLEEIRSIQSKLQTVYGKYCLLREQNTDRAQAYVLLSCLSGESDPKVKLQHLHFMKSHLQSELSAELSELLKNYENSDIDWKELENDLYLIESGTYQVANIMKKGDIINDLVRVCQEATECIIKEDKTEDHSSEILTTLEADFKNNKFHSLLQRLGLQQFYPKKMTKHHVLTIDKSVICDRPPQNEQELPLLYLRGLIMLDYRTRYLIYKVNSTADTAMTDTEKTSISIDDFLGDNMGNNTLNIHKQEHIHPMDIQMTVFHCSDDFLRQYLFTKMSMCQYALPLLVPNPFTAKIEFPLWSFQQVKKSWQCLGEDKHIITCKDSYISSASLPLVSFVRFGNSLYSKSQILSNMISRQKHNVFFHRHCSGSSPDVCLMDGVVEIAWYCPGGRESDIFDRCVAFTNLHGDALEHDLQFKFLDEIAAVHVIMVFVSDCTEKGKKFLQDLFNSVRPVILLCTDKEVITGGISSTKVKIAAKNRNETEFIDELTATLKRFLTLTDQSWNLNSCSHIAKNLGFVVDEDDSECKQGKEMAAKMQNILKDDKLSIMKEKYAPLQGDLWHQWCLKNKELHHLCSKEKRSIEEYRSKVESEKKSIRTQQQKKATPVNALMESFIQSLSSHHDKTKKYFLHYLTIFLDNLSSGPLTELQQKYHRCWTKLLECKQSSENSQALDILQQELNGIATELNASSFGLEHLFREIGQLYEAVVEATDKPKWFAVLPEIAADMMLSGYPIELMDGDAAHVPLKWIGSVLDKVIEKTGDKRLFVLSVLGIQSTGKSTLLNAMFGLQLNVSAGRCTRGAFMQLIKLDDCLRSEMNFDFVLVVDTEGLRAPELSNTGLNHDNQLATFVIGLGNVTIINIFGENPSEMQDILQIAVQAFLRMKQVRLSPSCLFVHQNVGDVTARDKNLEGRRRMQEKLDEMARIAGKQEQCNVMRFKDVIQFDVNLHTYYFVHLWEGDPPMAPPNPSYSQSVQDLKNVLLTTAQQYSNSGILKISELKGRIQDLWEALLAEHFVFSFKNTQEIEAYSKLETKYGHWTWQLRKYMLDVESKLYNQIENGILESIKKIQIENQVLETYESCKKDIYIFFENERDRELLVQWKSRTELKVEELKNDLIDDVKHKCDELLKLKKGRKKLDEKKSGYEYELLKRSRQLASELKNKTLEESELDKAFQTLWSTWIAEVASEKSEDKKVDIVVDIETALFDKFKDKQSFPGKMLGSKNEHFLIEFKKQLIMKGYIHPSLTLIKCKSGQTDKQNALNYTASIITEVHRYILNKEKLRTDYSSSYIYEILQNIYSMITDFNTKKEEIFMFSNNYRIDLSVYLCFDAEKFEKMHQIFKNINDPITYLGQKRQEYFNNFKIFCQGASATTTFAYLLCNKLKSAILQAVYDKTAVDIADEMRSDYPAFNGNRSKLETHILIDLAEKEDFEQFMKYINSSKELFEEFIKEKVDAYTKSKLKSCLNSRLRRTEKHILTCLDKAVNIVKDKKDMSVLPDELCKQLGDLITLPQNVVTSVVTSVDIGQITDFDFFKESLIKTLENEMERLNDDIQNGSAATMEHSREKPDEILFKQLAGCWEQCPFCGAVCTNTIQGHDGDHSVSFHLPQAVRGVQWHKTNHLVRDICSSLVASSYLVLDENTFIPYKDYRSAGPRYKVWSITPDTSTQLYWKWFIKHFWANLEKTYNLVFQGHGIIPNEWGEISKVEALQQLKEMS